MNKLVKKIGFLTSGGDAPGMNAAIRAITRSCVFHNITPVAIYNGFQGVLDNEFKEFKASSVGNILQHGGTILKSSRCMDWISADHRKRGAENLRQFGIDALIVIGGDGSFKGLDALNKETQIKVCGIPGTIDNDISHSDYSIGYDTAVQTAIEAVDRIRDTASSHSRTFLVEVMGRNSAAIAIKVGVCTGAESVILPSEKADIETIYQSTVQGAKRGKNSSIHIIAEGPTAGRSYDLQHQLREKFNLRSQVCILGHIQRGGSPTAFDRFAAAQMGNIAVEGLIKNLDRKVTTMTNGKIILTDLDLCLEKNDDTELELIQLAKTLAI